NKSLSKCSTPYLRVAYAVDLINDYDYEQFESYFFYESMQTAVKTYFAELSSNNSTQPSTYTTSVKCNIKIRNKSYLAIINSGASISMISYQIVKELELKIDTCSSSLIVSATGPSIRPLGIIKDLSIEIKGITISIDIEVIDATSYSLLLGND